MFVVMLSLSVSNVYPIETAGIYDTTLLYCSIRFWALYLYTPTVSNVYPIETAGSFSSPWPSTSSQLKFSIGL
jgi:hypothetical protein